MIKLVFEEDAAFFSDSGKIKTSSQNKETWHFRDRAAGPWEDGQGPRRHLPPFAVSGSYAFAMALAFCMNAVELFCSL